MNFKHLICIEEKILVAMLANIFLQSCKMNSNNEIPNIYSIIFFISLHSLKINQNTTEKYSYISYNNEGQTIIYNEQTYVFVDSPFD